jgi:dihydropyrimidinase
MKDQKELGRGNFAKIPNGMPGVETRMYLMWEAVREGKISINRFVEITSTAPAKIFGMYPRKGTLAVGADADIVVWDPDKRHTITAKSMHMRVDYSPLEGREMIGAPMMVMQRGRTLVRAGSFLGQPGQGQFLRRSTWSL